jgi:hypothetical protein
VSDGYVQANFERHLVGCRKQGKKELATLLLEFRWTEQQLDLNGFLRLNADLALLRPSITSYCGPAGKADGVALCVGLLRGLKLIYGVLQLAWGAYAQDPQGACVSDPWTAI